MSKLIQHFETAQRKPAMLLADYRMPGMDGMALIHRGKSNHPALTTISISGTSHLSEMAVIFAAGKV